MTELTLEDINILIEALDAWKDKDALTDLLEDLMPMMLGHSREDARKIQEEHNKRQFGTKQMREAAKANRKEQAIVLQAKLFEIRKKLEASA